MLEANSSLSRLSTTHRSVKRDTRWATDPFGWRSNMPQIAHAAALLADSAMLIVINAQIGMLTQDAKGRSNLADEKHILQLLDHWRARCKPVTHVKHESQNPDSCLHAKNPGWAFMDGFAPLLGETTIIKAHASAFTGTNLAAVIKRDGIDTLILTGFAAQDCVLATARDAKSQGLRAVVVCDTTAIFDLTSAAAVRVLKTLDLPAGIQHARTNFAVA